jgi:2-keto-4-pentenoate hydratase
VAWLEAHGHLDAPAVRSLAADTVAALTAGQAPPAFGVRMTGGKLAEAYAVQRRVVRALGVEHRVAGYKGAGASAAAQSSLGIDRPLTGVLFRSGRIEAGAEPVVVERAAGEAIAVETEIGYVMGVDFSFTVPTAEHARDAVAAIVPVIELPRSFGSGGTPEARNMVASNVGSSRFIVGPRIEPASTDPNAWKISLQRDGTRLHETTGDSAKGGQWENLLSILNQITGQGYVIKAGDVIICGALGQVHPGEPGRYEARFGEAATLKFEVR